MRTICVSLLLGGMVFAADATKDSWPLFRGNPEQTGVASRPLPDKLRIQWQFKAKDGIEGTAVIADGTVFIGSFDGHLYALGLVNGQEKWKSKLGAIKAAPGFRDGRLYVGNEDGKYYCIDAANGKPHWTFDAESDVTSGTSFSGDDILFGTGNQTLFCLTKEGKKKWSFAVAGGPVNATPAIAGKSTFVAGCDSKLHVIDTTTGKEVRDIDLSGPVGATGALAGNILYAGTMSNDVQAIDWKNGKVLWTYTPVKRPQPFQSSVALTDSLVIIGSKDKRIHAIDRKSGEPVWTFLTEGRVDSSPVVVGKRVYAGSLDGKLYVLDRDKGTLIQKIELDSDIVGSPAVAGDRLIIATLKGVVYCLGQ